MEELEIIKSGFNEITELAPLAWDHSNGYHRRLLCRGRWCGAGSSGAASCSDGNNPAAHWSAKKPAGKQRFPAGRRLVSYVMLLRIPQGFAEQLRRHLNKLVFRLMQLKKRDRPVDLSDKGGVFLLVVHKRYPPYTCPAESRANV